ncbi:TPA: hypothetical protein IB184_004071, partial [Escherichia coli]|nr:hypothetical protein [Escherichia coli]
LGISRTTFWRRLKS